MKKSAGILFVGIVAAAMGAGPDLSKLPPPSGKQGVTFAKDIQPLFAASCTKCHGDQRPKGELSLKTLAGVLKGGKDGKVVTPGKSEESALVIAAAQIDDGKAKGPAGEDLALRVRAVVADAAERTLRQVGHALGPAPLAFDEQHARRVADLELYLRQHHAERDLARLGELMLARLRQEPRR